MFLAGLGAHMQLLFACEVMDGAPKLVCCCDTEAPADGCDNGGGCVTHAAAAQGCCQIMLAPVADLMSMTSTPQGQLLTLFAAAQAPPITPPAAISSHRHVGIGAGLPLAYTAFWLPGVRTYLYTNRFRI